MTCKDCYHCDVCSEKDGTTNFYGKKLACNDVEKRCQYFNDKSRIIELPRKKTDFSDMFINCKSLKPLPPFDIDEIKKKSLIEKLKSLLKKQS